MGRTRGTGVLKVAFRRPLRTLVDGEGHVGGADTIVLEQTVRRGDRPQTHRVWRLTRTAPGRYTGTLSDAAGPVSGDVRCRQLYLAFRMRGGFSAKQWLVLQPGDREARNVMVVTRFGLPVARLDETIDRR